jgi:transmembrane sensor
MGKSDTYAIEQQAAAWVARMDGAGWTEAQEAELSAWLAADRRHRGALLQAQSAWISLDEQARAAERDMRLSGIGRRGALFGGGAIAASLAGAALWVRSGTTYRTALGEIRHVPLADGSVAAINSGSELQIRLADRRREIRLDSGEAWFRVAKDPSRPFVVEAGGVVVQAVGTAFSVRRRPEGADVLVTEGIVEAWAGGSAQPLLRLAAGQRAFIGENADVEVAPDVPSAVDRTLAWRQGSIDLDGDTLASAVSEFNRYNRRKLVLVDPQLVGHRFDGTFHTDDPEGFATAVGNSYGVPIDFSDATVIRIGQSS